MVVCVVAAALATRMIDVDVRDEVLMAVMRSRRLLLESCQTKLMLSKKTTEIEVENRDGGDENGDSVLTREIRLNPISLFCWAKPNAAAISGGECRRWW